MKNIFICGGHNTGKSTLVNSLSDLLEMPSVSEKAQELINRDDLFFKDHSWQNDICRHNDFQKEISYRQIKDFEKITNLNSSNSTYIFDRGPDFLAYQVMYSTVCGLPSNLDIITKVLSESHVFVLEPLEEIFESDYRDYISSCKITFGIECFLNWNGIRYTKISRDLSHLERVKLIQSIVDKDLQK